MAEGSSVSLNLPPALQNALGRFSGRGDIVFALAIVGIITILLFPVPTWMLDLMLGVSITLAVIILMTVIFVEKPLDLSSFPSILLISAVLRLSLNIASTRLILSEGHTGTDAAGHVIEAFGHFVMGGSVVIGAIVFAILTLINFVVITKGSGRIAEVSARFSLDAMPGKQMAIDADLSAGLIDEDTARTRRKELEDESTFFGAMDGANKFVRGDAIAGLLITLINLIGGMIIGIAQRDLSFSDAMETYTILTIGDGLVSQIPAIVVSISAGLLVTKSGTRGSAEKAIFEQLGSFPQTMAMASLVLFAMALMPGIPAIPFVSLAIGTGVLAWLIVFNKKTEKQSDLTGSAPMKQLPGPGGQMQLADGSTDPDAVPAAPDEPISETLHIDALKLELGYALLPLLNYQQGHRLTDQIKALRKQLAKELGFIMSPVRIQDNMQLPANHYVVKVKDITCGEGDIRPDMLLIMNPSGEPIDMRGENTREPTFGLPAMWVSEDLREEALFKNYTVVDPPTVITTHLTEVIKENMSELLSYSETQKLLDELPSDHQKLVADTVPAQISIGGLQRILQKLLSEQISIRDMPAILEAIAEATRITQNTTLVTEHVRMRLARQISHSIANLEGTVMLATLSPEWEQAFQESLAGQGEERQLAMAPSKIQEFIQSVRTVYDELAMRGEVPALLTSPAIRPYVRSIIERFRPGIIVLSQNEIHVKAKIQTLGEIK